MTAPKDKYLINSVLRAAQILDSFSLEKTSFTHAEISKTLHINKATVTRLLYTLEHAGFLEKDIAAGTYSLTVKLFQIGSVYLSKIDIHKAAMPYLSELATRYKETTHLAVLNENEVFFIDRVESTQSIRMKSLVGSRLPAYCTALGKVLLAYQDRKFLDTYFKSVELKRYTRTTITDPGLLRKHLDEIKARGYAIDDIEHENELKSVAAPLKDYTGKVVAGISVVGPAYRMQDAGLFAEITRAVVEAADKVSRRLGHMS